MRRHMFHEVKMHEGKGGAMAMLRAPVCVSYYTLNIHPQEYVTTALVSEKCFNTF